MQLWIKIILLELPRALSYTHPHTQVRRALAGWFSPVPETTRPEFEAVNYLTSLGLSIFF